MEFELLLSKIVMHTFSLIITHATSMLIEIFLVMATSGFAHTARAVRLWVGIVGVGVCRAVCQTLIWR